MRCTLGAILRCSYRARHSISFLSHPLTSKKKGCCRIRAVPSHSLLDQHMIEPRQSAQTAFLHDSLAEQCSYARRDSDAQTLLVYLRLTVGSCRGDSKDAWLIASLLR